MTKRQRIFRGLLFSAVAAILFSSCAFGQALADIFLPEEMQGVVTAVTKLTEEITPEDSYYIGRTVAANILSNYKVYNDKSLQKYLNKICNTLAINSDDPYLYNGYHVVILDAPYEVNAYSTPGGHILVTTGLIGCADTEDALAAVIAHEIAHIQLKHSLGSIKASRFKDTLDALDSAFSDDDMEDVSDDIISSMVGSGFSQGQEYDADEKAIQLMAASGYQPSAMISMLEEMKAFEKSASKSGFFKTHPSPSSRISNIKPHVKKAEKDLENTMEYREERYEKAVK